MPEIERKYKLTQDVPTHVLDKGVRLSQGYLYTHPGEMRIRRYGDSCFVTVKGDGTLAREEWEQPLPDWAFLLLWPHTEGKRIEKTRYSIPYGDYTLELDIYQGLLTGLVVLECEFADEEQAAGFSLPEWASGAVEVTSDRRYKNKSLAENGMPLN